MASAEEVDNVELIEDLDNYSGKFNTSIHGILHLLTHEQLKLLDTFEGGYVRKPCKVTLYDNSTQVNAYVYSMDRNKWKLPHQLPTERYLDIIVKGCTFHGVNNEWIEYIKSLKTIPRKKPIDFTSFTMQTAVVPILSWDEIKENLKPGQEAWERPDIVSRVFAMKLEAMLDDILKMEPQALATVKRLVRACATADDRTVLDDASESLVGLLRRAEAAEGIQAFKAKTAPGWAKR